MFLKENIEIYNRYKISLLNEMNNKENQNFLDVLFDDANSRITAFNSTHNKGENSPRGVVCYGWPQFYTFFEKFKLDNEQIKNLFLDFDMDHLKGIDRDKHPLTQIKPGQSYKTHKEQIENFRKEHSELAANDMLYYHPSGQGVTEYLMHNVSSLKPKINQIVIHCKNNHAYEAMNTNLKSSGYVNILRMNAKDLNKSGFLII
jgi:hypothetical protein